MKNKLKQKAGRASWLARKKNGGIAQMKKLSKRGLKAVGRGKDGRFKGKRMG